jgi:hypothetical protein
MPVTEFRNLPGVTVHKDDGNLFTPQNLPGDVHLVIGTAPDGPSGFYFNADQNEVARVFDPNGTGLGTLIRGGSKARIGGSGLVAYYRIGAYPAVLDFINGWTLVTREANAVASSLYQVEYSFNAGAHIMKAYRGETLVYDSLTGLDTGAIGVYFDPSKQLIDSGTLTIAKTSLKTATLNILGSTAIAGVTQGQNYIDITALEAGDKALIKAGMVLVLAGAATADNTSYVVNYVYDNKVYLSQKLVSNNWVSFTGFTATDSADCVISTKIRFIEAETGLNLTYTQKFEELAKAYWALETAKIDFVTVEDIFVDVPNIIDNEGDVAVPGVADFLGTVYQFELNGEIYNIWDMTGNDAGDITPAPYSLGLDGINAHKLVAGTYTKETILTSDAGGDPDVTFHEANFAHQMAEYLHNLSVNDNEAYGAISMLPPVNFSKPAIYQWLGELPYKDTNGDVLASGKGVLGYKYLSGSATVGEGFFHTNSGFVDGTALKDRNGFSIDIGRYLSVLAMPLIVRDGSTYSTSAAAIYAGLAGSLDRRESPLNKQFRSSIGIPFLLPKKALDDLTGSKYVCFTVSPVNGLTKVVDAPTAALKTSDYHRFSTNRLVSLAVDVARNITEPFIGKMFGGALRVAAEEQVISGLTELKNGGYLTAGIAMIRATQAMQIKGDAEMALVLEVPGELRKLVAFVSLSNRQGE